ncbi:DUF3307 domain-containing protein [Reichenbachiella agarivorans]|uniref:DUF3307 domain-containing protein n=1 Tax=Reichenbachiella agarivorans TaxID=2979464 RepID=A0ABY6CM83_9BACT|nr:DUF3307 domain-containing protein [Reichenbachiella agarivorans]UXP31623.1 DUF3307 domain-containing protein [Reichenbachiella agarivorans]
MIILSLKLLLAHLIGDFLLQPNHWVKDKETKQHKSKYLYWHIAIHAATLLVLLSFNRSYLFAITIIVSSHYLIDLTKIKLSTLLNARVLFFADQTLHLLVLALVIHWQEPYSIDINKLLSEEVLLLAVALLTVTIVTSVIMKIIIAKWQLDEAETIPNQQSLDQAGKYIGMLERLFVFGFIVANQWQAIGFLLAAKSVFRFGDLSKSKDRKLTEYILIGTLLSFGFAMLTGLCYNYLRALILS